MSSDFLYFESLFNELFEPFGSGIVYHNSGICVHMNYERLYELGCLQKACQEVHKYIPLNDGDTVILNDPYSGGGALNNFTLLMGFKTQGAKKADFILGLKFSTRPTLSFGATLDDEGLRVPPTPIAQDGKINEALLSSIVGHPQAPKDFEFHFRMAFEKLLLLHERFTDAIGIWNVQLSTKNLSAYIDHCNTKMVDFLTHFRQKDSFHREQWHSGENISLKTTKEADHMIFEFGDAEKSSYYNLTKPAVFGACFGAIINTLEQKFPLNSGTFEAIKIKLPEKSFLQSKYPAPSYFGFVEGTGLIANLSQKTLSKLDRDFQAGEGNVGTCSIDITFENQTHFFDRLPSGQGANKDEDGSMAVDKWTHYKLSASIEDIEKRFPMQIKSTSFRQASGGSGSKNGGLGVIRSYEVREPALLKWFAGYAGHAPDGINGGNSGLGPQIIHISGNVKTRLDQSGEMKLKRGDKVNILTAGGGGFGE
ncbi:MAG: hydantoinase B/oxoprolinase family protein [Bdellovibrionales bacterium]